MFGNILGKKKDNRASSEAAKIDLKISKMNLTEMRSYVNNRLSDFKISKDGLIVVMKKIVKRDDEHYKTYLQLDDMDIKKKKGFELILMISKNKHISVEVVELMQEFVTTYDELIKKFDSDYSEIYASRLTDAIEVAINNVNSHLELQRKVNVLGE